MSPATRLRLVLALALAPGTLAAAQKPVLAILDFLSPEEPSLGVNVARRLDKRIHVAQTHLLPDREDIRLAVEQAGLKVKLQGNEEQIQAFARERLEADIVLWGAVQRLEGRKFRIRVRAMGTRGPPQPYLDEEHVCANFAAVSNFYTKIEPVLLKQRARVRKLHPVSAAARARNLVANPSFEKGTWSPEAWTKVDGLTSFWIDRPDGKGKCLKVDTEVLISQAVAWWEKMKTGKYTAQDAPRKLPVPKSQIYSTVGGLDGVYLFGDWIPVKPNMRYRLTVDIKGRWAGIFIPKAFVKGYALQTDEFTTQKRELFRAYLNCRTQTQGRQWETFTRTLNPTLRTPRVRFMRVALFAYWPLGLYYWDNIRLSEEAIED